MVWACVKNINGEINYKFIYQILNFSILYIISNYDISAK